MRVSIITPVYHGNRYLNDLLCNINKSCSNIKGGVELILVNDSPDVQLNYDISNVTNFRLVETQNKKNSGIHQSRINGLRVANGQYIIFLDQDDKLSQESIITQLRVADSTQCDIVLGNGYIEDGEHLSHLIFGNNFSLRFATKEKPYLLARDFIVSPGQCLVKRESIPTEWTVHAMHRHGADDYLLWLLCFNTGCKIAPNYKPIYTHINTGSNFSNNKQMMSDSLRNMLQVLRLANYPENKLRILEKTIKFKSSYKQHPIKCFFRNPLIFLYNIYYRIVWKGYLER